MTLHAYKNKALTVLQTIALTVTVLLVSPAVMALDLTLGASYVSKSLTDNTWKDIEDQKGFGVDVTFVPPIIPFLEVIGGVTSQSADFKVGLSTLKFESRDIYLGLGAGFTFLGLVRPSIGAGVISSSTKGTSTVANNKEKVSSSESGLWYGVGVRVHFLSSFFAQYRLLNTYISRGDFAAKLDAQMNILTFGYSFL